MDTTEQTLREYIDKAYKEFLNKAYKDSVLLGDGFINYNWKLREGITLSDIGKATNSWWLTGVETKTKKVCNSNYSKLVRLQDELSK